MNVASSFNNDASIGALLLTSRVGSLGLNLTGATVVVFLEMDWNPGVDLQAMDRCHRIGQGDPVNVYRVMCRGTVEERVRRVQEGKEAIRDGVINGENSSIWSMGTDRLLDFFGYDEEEESGGGQNGATKVAKLQDYPKNDVDSLAKIEDTRAQSDEEDYNFLQSRVGGVGTNSL